MITFDNESKIIKIDTENTSYAMKIVRGKYVAHLYYGAKTDGLSRLYKEKIVSFAPYPAEEGVKFSLDTVATELSFFGSGDLKDTAIKICGQNGDCTTLFKLEDFRIYKGGAKGGNLPYSRDGDETLELIYFDEVSGCKLHSYYTVYENSDTLIRKAKIVNESDSSVSIRALFACQLDFTDKKLDMLTLAGKYYSERHKQILPIGISRQSIYSKCGHSSHRHNPFAALVSKHIKENSGEAYGVLFGYSGDFEIQTEKLFGGFTRLLAGMNRDTFEWRLLPNEEFYSPETVLTYSDRGLNGMSQNLHDHIRKHIVNPKFVYAPRPILVNTWEAVYFKIDNDVILRYAENASHLGIDMIVVDDGWFGERDDDKAALGDWFVNRKKFPDGLLALAERVRDFGVKFGIWIEPEMINADSDLFRAHPEWVLGSKNREYSLSRNQLVLDLTNPEVADYVGDCIIAALKDVKPDYIKWDFNRSLTEVGSAYLPKELQGEASHRFVLGSYRLHEKLTRAFPDAVFEGCSGGGGRFDAGILHYVPQIWTSDQTDPVRRLPIQLGTSVAYPLSTMSAHVSHRKFNKLEEKPDYGFRFAVALWGVTGYETDITSLSADERETLKKQTRDLKKYQPLLLSGDLFRLDGLYKKEYAFAVVSKDKTEFLFDYISVGKKRNVSVKLFGLNENCVYTDEAGNGYSGKTLMQDGLKLQCTDKGKYCYSIRYFVCNYK